MSDAINPYQPPSTSLDVDGGPINEFSFDLTSRNLNHGQSHHLIRCRPYGVVIVSILAIIVSLAVFVFALKTLGSLSALVVMPFTMAFSAAGYLAVIAEPKRQTQQRMTECGLVSGATVTIHFDHDDLLAQTGENSIHWKRSEIKCYRTPRGLMIVPEQFVYFFLPSYGQFDRTTYKAIAKMFLKQKSAPQRATP